MLPSTLIKGFDKRRLKRLLALFFLALAVPTGILIWQAYSQLKWEAFHQYRGMAEELTARVDSGLASLIDDAERRSFGDYSFLVVSGEADASFTRPSPLSSYPANEELPGVIGHFQVDSKGTFSTPLLPQSPDEAEAFGITADEYQRRHELADDVQAILSDNRLVQVRPAELVGRRRGLAAGTVVEAEAVEEIVAQSSAEPPADKPQPSMALESRRDEASPGAFVDADEISPLRAAENYSQEAFDQLNVPASAPATMQLPRQTAAVGAAAEPDTNSLGKVADLKLDAELEKKSEAAENLQRESQDSPFKSNADAKQQVRRKRVEKDAVAEVVVDDVRISAFESEIDPFEFSLLDSGHFVMFRNVWRDGERYIQGLLINQREFIDAVIDQEFRGTALSQMSDLIVAFQDDVIHTVNGQSRGRYVSTANEMQGNLLYQGRLSAPLDNIGLIFSINRLPAGPGASVLGWVTLVLAMVFLGGFYAMYRLGLGQIRLARQQQDFVSAVSHELKTPLTSIRMYGEMLKDGWADKAKQQQYYEYIHDESERLTRLISNVLQLASITRNEPQLDVQPIRVATLINQVESKISNQVMRAGFELHLTCDPNAEAAEIAIDDDCFSQIIINLVDNAIKFSKDAENKTIDIGARLNQEKQVVFSVRDYGPGIPRNQMKKIFKLFYRTESELTRETVGTGIGLAIVHQLTQAMEGRVDVLNMEPGAEFRITFAAQ